VVGQALSHAALIKEKYNLPATPLFATTNPGVIVVFSPVEDPWQYLNREAVEEGVYERALEPDAYVRLIHKHYLLDDKRPAREELLQRILDRAAELWQRKVLPGEVCRPVGDWLIGKLRYFVDLLSTHFVEDTLRRKLEEDTKFAADLNALAIKAGYKKPI